MEATRTRAGSLVRATQGFSDITSQAHDQIDSCLGPRSRTRLRTIIRQFNLFKLSKRILCATLKYNASVKRGIFWAIRTIASAKDDHPICSLPL